MNSLVALGGLVLLVYIQGALGVVTYGPCSTYDNTQQICVGCVSGFELKADLTACTAKQCPTNCKVCDSQGNCTMCNDGYYLDANKACIMCTPDCKECRGLQEPLPFGCKVCKPGFRLTPFFSCERCNSKCAKCDADPATCDDASCEPSTYKLADPNAEVCTGCTDNNCKVCAVRATCTECNKGYFLNSGACTKCGTGCLACTSANDCSECPSGFYWDTTTKSCMACHTKCLECDLILKCKVCSDGWFPDAGTCKARTNCVTVGTNGQCAECAAGFKLETDGTCTACLDMTPAECTTCIDGNRGRHFRDGLCTYCMDNCRFCSSNSTHAPFKCDVCMANYVWNATSGACESCNTLEAAALPTSDCEANNKKCKNIYKDTASTAVCKNCPTTATGSTEQACTACPGFGWFENCTSCSPLPTTEAPCLQCAAAKSGIYWDSSNCMQYNCTVRDSAAKCEACGVSNVFVPCRACPSNLTTLASKDECDQCSKGFWDGSNCYDSTSLDCTGSIDNEGKCKYCGPHYLDATDFNCKSCKGTTPTTEAECKQCPGKYWSTTCQDFDCSTVASGTAAAQCNACNYLGWYHDGSACVNTLNCTSPTAMEECNACDGWMYNSTHCLEVNAEADVLTNNDTCQYYNARFWNATSSTCHAVKAGLIGVSVHAGLTTAAEVVGGPTLWRDLTSGSEVFEKPTCDDLSTVEECTECGGAYWDSVNTKCKVVDCSASAATQKPCEACPGRYFASTCQSFTGDCATVTDQNQCRACRHQNYYWDGSSCKRTDCMNVENMAGEQECNACEGVYWNSTACLAGTEGVFENDEAHCEAFWTRVLINNDCNVLTSKIGASIDERIWNSTSQTSPGNPFKIIGFRYFQTASPGTIFELPVTETIISYQDGEAFCKSHQMPVRNRYWPDTPADSDCIDLKTHDPGCANAYVRNANSLLCNKCVGFLYDTTTKKCKGTDMANPSNIKNEAECNACGHMYVWDKPTNQPASCRKLTCGADERGNTARCTACSLPDSPMYTSGNECFNCMSGCAVCAADECIKCQDGHVLNADGLTCSACSSSEVFDEATRKCKTCPSNCAVCSTNNMCTSCKPGFILRGGNCIECLLKEPECRDCPAANQGRRWDSSQSPSCVSCPANCKSCDASGCKVCVANSFLSGSTCVSCGGTASEELCKACGLGRFDSATSTCISCSQNCEECSDTACTKCKVGYYIKAGLCEVCTSINGECAQCTSDATVTPAGGKCTKCNNGLHLLNDGSTCQANSANCITYDTGSAGCTNCKIGFYKSNSGCEACDPGCKACQDNNGATCDKNQCLDNYFMNPLSKCSKCVENCAKCSVAAECEVCDSTYCVNKDNGLCVLEKTGTNCGKCSVATDGTTTCVDCRPGTSKDVCKDCLPSCAECTSGTTCTRCADGTFPDASPATVCTACPANCKTCTDATSCTACKDGFYELRGNTSSTCEPCLTNCAMCTTGTDCSSCIAGYALNVAAGGATECKKCVNNCGDCKNECTACGDGYQVDPTVKQCVASPTTAPPPSGSTTTHQMSVLCTLLATILSTLVLMTFRR